MSYLWIIPKEVAAGLFRQPLLLYLGYFRQTRVIVNSSGLSFARNTQNLLPGFPLNYSVMFDV
ncbi:MAG: hypothetical protein COW65_00700 [Cytophagales bacterium CG18_big_fil_WC_8_21_14_2_50_42_9]|nr:MAG: hypothetical protein COW65_00700 [Cytophagales bacterium CG18_big_fil_WC_8_21_14_2_50_42_9]